MGHVTLVGMVGKLVTSRAAWKRTGGPSGSLCVRIFSIMLKLTAAGCGEAELGAPTEDRRARIQRTGNNWSLSKHPKSTPLEQSGMKGQMRFTSLLPLWEEKRKGENEAVDGFILAK